MTPRAAFRRQAETCAEMGSPFTARLCRLLADRIAPGDTISDRLLGWTGDPSSGGDAMPLRLAGALHGLVLTGADAGLAAIYPPTEADDDVVWRAVAAAIRRHAATIDARLDRPPQTNETQRCAGLAPGYLTVAARTGLPLVTSELGASAGLNMIWDRFRYRFGDRRWGDPGASVAIEPDWRGPPPPDPVPMVAERAGCDRDPVDLSDPDERVRLASFVWPDQPERLARLRAALSLAQAEGIEVERADAPDWLEARLAVPRPGHAHVVSHSVFWQYLSGAEQARCSASLSAAGSRSTDTAPLAWLRMERGGDGAGAALLLTLWPGAETREIGRIGFHGAWVDWRGWAA